MCRTDGPARTATSHSISPRGAAVSSESAEPVFLIDVDTGDADPMTEITLASVGLKEKADLQRWMTQYPEIVGPDLLLITTEFNQWEIPDRLLSHDRLPSAEKRV